VTVRRFVIVAALSVAACHAEPPDPARLAVVTPSAVAYDVTTAVAGYTPRQPLFKHYPTAERVPLSPSARSRTRAALFDVLARRRSRRRFGDGGLPLDDLSSLLWAAAGVTGRRWGMPLRTAPSGGALYPVEVYVVAHAVQGLVPGVYHLAVEPFVLERLRTGSWGAECAWASIDQTGRDGEACTVVMTMVVDRITQKYGTRGERYGWVELGAVMQNVLLAAEAGGFAACPMGAFHDDRVAKILGLTDEREVPGLLIPVGPCEP